MNCPSCSTQHSYLVELTPGLRAVHCQQCKGHWISHDHYRAWLRQQGETLPRRIIDASLVEREAGDAARICPDCEHILLKYEVGCGLPFRLDHCSTCGGIWLDRHEWKALESCNLHDEIHHMFSVSWQRSVRGEQMRTRLGQVYARRFGKQDFDAIRDARRWIQEHPEKAALLAFLDTEDPYTLHGI